MAIGSTINTSHPTAGTTISAYAKAQEGMFLVDLGGYSGVLTMAAASPAKSRSGIRLTLKKDPSWLDASDDNTGKVAITVNCNFSIGSTITLAVVSDFMKEMASVMASDSVIDALVAGSLV